MAADTKTLLAKCDELAAKFAERASIHDLEASFPRDNFADLREAGMLGLMVPESHGGFGVDMLTYTKVVGRLAQGDGATALAFNMHNIITGTLAEMDISSLTGRWGKTMSSFREWAFAEVMAGKLFAACLSEPGAGFHPGSIKTSYRRVDGGYVLNGRKSFVSMAGNADYYVVACVSEESGASETPAISWMVVALDDAGVQLEKVWNSMGMRATVSDDMYLKDCFVPKERLFLGMEGLVLQKLAAEPHLVIGGLTAVYMGLIDAVYKFVVDYLRGKRMHQTGAPLIENEMLRHRVGEMSVLVEAARELTYSAARMAVTDRGSRETNAAIHRAKYFVGEMGPRIASEAIRICGGSTVSKHLPMERYYRDIRCCGVMPAKSDECLWYVGKDAFGYDMSKVAETYW